MYKEGMSRLTRVAAYIMMAACDENGVGCVKPKWWLARKSEHVMIPHAWRRQ
jgi:hypothetical protein